MTGRQRKALRDKSITQNFFNQGVPSTRSSSAEQNVSPAIRLPAFSELSANAEKLRARVSALWKRKYDNLSSEEHEKVQKAMEMLPTPLDPRSVLESLNLGEDQIAIVMSSDGEIMVKETFDLADLNKVAQEYDKLCVKYKLRGENQMAALAQGISKLTSIASDTMRSSETRMAAELDVLNHSIVSKITVPLISCLRQFQLFNVEKRFGFVEESYQALKQEDERKPGEDAPAKPRLSFRQQLNDPFEPTEPAPETRQKKREKKLSGLEALTQLQRNLKLASEEIKDLKDTNDTQEFEETFTYAAVPIPEKIPDYVRKRFSDAGFGLGELSILIDESSDQLLKVRSALLAWSSASHQVWETGKTLVHELPLFREYDYYRTAMFATLSILSRSEVKIIEFFSGRRAPEFSAAMREVFRLKSMSLEEFKKDWDMRILQMLDHYPSVDNLIAQIEDAQK